ncbi:hypothetical protein ES705_34290 [subsurface metagenome]
MVMERHLDLLEKSQELTKNVTTATAEVAPVNKMRSSCILCNDSDTILYLGFGRDAVLHQGCRLNAAGGSYEINATNMFRGYITAIHDGVGDKVLIITEVEGYAAQ